MIIIFKSEKLPKSQVGLVSRDERRRPSGTDWIDIISFGFFILMVGMVWIISPKFHDEVTSFVNDFRFENLTGNVGFPAPVNNHPVLYTAIMQLCLVVGVFQIVILALRFLFHESVERKAGTISGMTFFFSAAFFLNMLAGGSIGWFGFIAGLIISVGLTIIASSVVRLFR